jgi:hypothetical protein
MANPFGLNFEQATIADTFATCVACFDYVLSGDSHRRAALRLRILRLRLGRWGEAVNIYHDLKLGQANPDPEDIEEIKATLVKLIALFENSNEEADGHRLSISDGVQHLPTLFKVLAEMETKRPRHPGLLSPRGLVLGGQPELLVRDACACIDKLEECFPAAQRQQELCNKEKADIKDASVLQTLQKEARGFDPWISPARKIAFHGAAESNIGVQLGSAYAGSSRLFDRDYIPQYNGVVESTVSFSSRSSVDPKRQAGHEKRT